MVINIVILNEFRILNQPDNKLKSSIFWSEWICINVRMYVCVLTYYNHVFYPTYIFFFHACFEGEFNL